MRFKKWNPEDPLPEGVTEAEILASEAYLMAIDSVKIRCPKCHPVNHGEHGESGAQEEYTSFECGKCGHTWDKPHVKVVHRK